ncbi:hypothetical protein SDC9_94490 [bioreactor metagenome]|uniref:MazG-like family protein n=1 Tax=bioreactor metagenome TaxID=1076179 RepID=A0A645ADN2_9ZZZZ|nr:MULTISPECIES: MazG-like family protein [Clostridium]KGK86800.1 MazG-like family protein [Clostridium sp. HMP27]MBE6067352.1 MazG-like family protein [Clostridium lundense]MBM7872187.1 stalled ribosome rescue protein Dom34 [Clostridium pascui]
MKKDDFNIMHNIKVIEELKAELLCLIGDFFRLLTRGSNVAQEAILDCIAGSITVLYILAERLGYSYTAVDENMKRKLKMGILEEDKVEKENKDLSRLYSHLKERQ